MTFRVRIGCFNLRNRTGKILLKKVLNKYNHEPSLNSLLMLFLGLLSVTAILFTGLSYSIGPSKYSTPKFVSNWNYTNKYSTPKLESFCNNEASRNVVWLSGSNCTLDWNSFINALNGNIKNTLTIIFHKT